ncbi:MAG: DUF4215 domain-containing protein, partial [Polyangiaceae bacterium]|nr:DUF4215 domain-containing protein [Polyangiaceae bacterium]
MKLSFSRQFTILATSTICAGTLIAGCGEATRSPGAFVSAGTGGSAAGGTSSTGDGDSGVGTGGAGDSGDGGQVGECGDGVTEGTEECDDGNPFETDSCMNDCTLPCKTDPDCDDGVLCNGVEVCTAENRCEAGPAADDGLFCATGMVCRSGDCILATCGDGAVQSPEECDDANRDADDGCENDCSWTCVSTDSTRDCTRADECEGVSTCDDDAATPMCSTPTQLTDDTLCDSGTKFCKAGVCTAPFCGNGIEELGETCDDGDNDDTNGCTEA